MSYKAVGTIIPSSEFYVRPVLWNGKRSVRQDLKQNKKIDLVLKIWQELPAGFGIGIENDLYGKYFLSFNGSLTELIDVEIIGNSKADVLRGVIPFTNKDYRRANFYSENSVLNRQISFVLFFRKSGKENKIKIYQERFNVSFETAEKEIQELTSKGIL